jgi:hypothetical protein
VTAAPATARRSLRQTRTRANLPRYALWTVLAVLALAGVRAIIAGPPPTPPTPKAAPSADLASEAYAQAFARAYLSWRRDPPERRDAQLATYVSADLDQGAGLSPPAGSAQGVLWTAALGDRRDSARQRTITVQAQTTNGLVYLAVPVGRDRRGFLFVAGYPALVGPPATNPAASAPVESDVDDRALGAVARRAITNYLAGELVDLRADLAPSARVSLPERRLRVTAVDQVTWVRPGERVAVQLEARGEDKSLWTLRYELGVQRTDRWYVRSVAVDPTATGGGTK